MARKIIDMSQSPRAGQFAYFSAMADPWAGATVMVDITDFLSAIREKGLPFFLSFLFAVTRAGNAVPELRRRGTAQALLQALQERLAARGIGSLMLEVRASNLPAQRLYTAAGFACIGRRPNYYLAPREDALILRKELDHADPCH